ncbi:MMPL family transporter [Nesterenkonia flava]|uniref:MMPL family transporter n=1 Tax=Nesterenkonia flava TaxID=469799 RepID=A0ABU1FV46_9MICC|nr:MMPL family transporter [Nesterenkonia flava]MDR5712493.1 MMPL family transporter [Nesterenkonia flava]
MFYRLGEFCARHARRVLVSWAVVLLLAVTAAVLLSRPTGSDYRLPGAEFQETADRINELLPEAGVGGTSMVFHTGGREFTAEQRAGLERIAQELEQLSTVVSVSDPFELSRQLSEAEAERTQAWYAVGQFLDEVETELDLPYERYLIYDHLFNPESLSEAYRTEDFDAQLDVIEHELEALDDVLVGPVMELVESMDPEEPLSISEQLQLSEAYVSSLRAVQALSEDSSVAILGVQLKDPAHLLSAEEREQLTHTVITGLPEGVGAEFGLELVQDLGGLLGPSEILGLAVALLVLLVVLGRIAAAGLPLLVTLVGAGTGIALIFTASRFVDIADTDVVLALMLGLAVGIDYALLYIYRWQRSFPAVPTPEELGPRQLRASLARSSAEAGRTIFFAAVTTMVALAALAVTGVPFLAIMGLSAALTIGIVALATLTAVPAALSLLGVRALRAPRTTTPPLRGLLAGVGSRIPGLVSKNEGTPEETSTKQVSLALPTRFPVPSLLVPLGLMVILALPVLDMRLALPAGSSEPEGSTAHEAYVLTAEHFGDGATARIYALAELAESPGDQADEAAQLQASLGLAQHFAADSAVARAAPVAVSDDGRVHLIQLTPRFGPLDDQTAAILAAMQDEREATMVEFGLDSLSFTGRVVADADLAAALSTAVPLYVGVVLLVCVVILFLLFRRLWIPLLTCAGYVLSLLAGLGAVVAVYQWGWGAELFGVVGDQADDGAVVAFLPMLMAGVLFGLAIDYQLFTASGMRQARAESVPGWAVVTEGLRRSRTVVLACGLIMVAVFIGFAYSELTAIRQISFALAVAILLEAFVVRTIMVPAAIQLLGERAWPRSENRREGGGHETQSEEFDHNPKKFATVNTVNGVQNTEGVTHD